MPGFGSVSPVRGEQEELRVSAQFTGAGAADATANTGYRKGVKSLTYNAATGKFILTMYDWPGNLVDAKIQVHRASGTAPLVGSVVWASVSKSGGTIPVEFWDLATPSLTNPAASEIITIELTFQKGPTA